MIKMKRQNYTCTKSGITEDESGVFAIIENSGNYILFCPESSRIPQEFLSAVKNTNVFEVSKGQFGEGSDAINRIVHTRLKVSPGSPPINNQSLEDC